MPNPYPDGNAMESKKTKQHSFVQEWNVARPAQGSGDGWATDKPVSGLGRIPTLGQKQLRGKTVKPITVGSIKGPWLCIVGKEEEGQAHEITERSK